MDKIQVDKIKQIFLENNNFVIVTHENPDIDGISSQLALAIALKNMGKNPFCLLENPPQNIDFLEGNDFIYLLSKENSQKLSSVFPSKFICVVVDTSEFQRIEKAVQNLVNKAEIFIVFDHHQKTDNPGFPKPAYFFADPKFASTTECLYTFFKNNQIQITSSIAHNLLAGLYYDTGSFKYENVNAKTFKIASELLALGADHLKIVKNLFENISLFHLKILKLVIERLELLHNQKIAISYVTENDLKEEGKLHFLSDIANFLRSIEGVEVCALIKEIKKGEISVSLRGTPPIEVVHLAKKFGGGGHKYASGFKIKAELFDFLNNFKKELVSYYEKHKKA